MFRKAKWNDLKVGMKVKYYLSDNIVYTIREIVDDKVFYSDDIMPYFRVFIPKEKLGKPFYELYFDDNQMELELNYGCC